MKCWRFLWSSSIWLQRHKVKFWLGVSSSFSSITFQIQMGMVWGLPCIVIYFLILLLNLTVCNAKAARYCTALKSPKSPYFWGILQFFNLKYFWKFSVWCLVWILCFWGYFSASFDLRNFLCSDIQSKIVRHILAFSAFLLP